MSTDILELESDYNAALCRNLEGKRIPSLDGLRGISALAVAVAHASALSRWVLADYAVVLFFEISGFLITWLLLSEQDRSGSIDRLAFMARRSLRLFPAFYVFWLLTWFVPGIPGRWWSFFYLMDLYNSFSPARASEVATILAMAWSLGVEEKYYLVWPAVLKRFDRRTVLKVTLGLFVCVQIYHLAIYKLGHIMWMAWNFDTRIDAVLLGSSLAIAVKLKWRAPKWMFHRGILLACVFSVILFSGVTWVHRLSFGVLAATFPLAIVLLSVVARPVKILNNAVTQFFGNISYSLYLYNALVVYALSSLPFPNRAARVTVSMLGAICAASLSYYLVEKPFLRVKSHYHRDRGTAPLIIKESLSVPEGIAVDMCPSVVVDL